MSANFDPYHKWLGILPKDQPPHYYRLLGLEPFEDDLQVIEAATDRQLGFLRKFQSGANAGQCQKLMNEISRARLCLLKPATKQTYDDQLHAKLTELNSPFQLDTQIEPRANIRKWPPPGRLAWVAAGALLLVVVSATAFLFQGQPQLDNPAPAVATLPPEPVDSKPQSAAPQPAEIANADHKPSAVAAVAPSTIKTPPRSDLPQAIKEQSKLEQKKQQDTPLAQKQPAVVDPAAMTKPAEVSGTSENTPQPDSDRPVGGEGSLAIKTTPIPTAADQEAASQKVRNLFSEEYANTKKDGDKLALALKLEHLAEGSDSDPAVKFVCREESGRLAAEAGDLDKAFVAIDLQAVEFQVDALQTKATALKNAAPKLKGPILNKEFVDKSLWLTEQLVIADQFPTAVSVATVAASAAAKVKNKALTASVLNVRRDMEEQAKEFLVADQARKTLQTQPDNTAAKVTWGQWVCLRKDQWAEGLKLLQEAGDEKVQELATRDLKEPTETEAAVQLGSDWLDYAKSRKDRSLARFCTRALHWLSQVHAKSAGLTKIRIESLIEQAYSYRDRNQPLLTLIDTVSKKVQLKEYVLSVESRHDFGQEYQEIPPEGAVLVGLNCRINKYLNYYTVIKGLQPVYATKLGLKLGEWRGKPDGVAVEIMARDGYAISNIGHGVGNCVDSIQVVFSRVTRTGLDLDQSYISNKVGGKQEISGYIRGEKPDTQPIIGMFGHAGDFWNGFGVITTK